MPPSFQFKILCPYGHIANTYSQFGSVYNFYFSKVRKKRNFKFLNGKSGFKVYSVNGSIHLQTFALKFLKKIYLSKIAIKKEPITFVCLLLNHVNPIKTLSIFVFFGMSHIWHRIENVFIFRCSYLRIFWSGLKLGLCTNNCLLWKLSKNDPRILV